MSTQDLKSIVLQLVNKKSEDRYETLEEAADGYEMFAAELSESEDGGEVLSDEIMLLGSILRQISLL